MSFFFWLIHANFWYLTYSSLNDTIHNQTYLALSTSSSSLNEYSRHGPKRHVLWRRQLPASALTVTATVTLTVTNTVFTPFATQTSTSISPSASDNLSILPITSPSQASETNSLPEFVTTTDAPISSSSLSSLLSLPSLTTPATFSTDESTLAPTPTSAPKLTSTSLSFESPTITPTSTSSFESPFSVSNEQSNSISSSLNTANLTNPSPTGVQAQNEQRPNRLMVPFIVVAIICSLGLLISFLVCILPYFRKARRRQQRAGGGSGSIFEDYSASARTFEPNAAGGLNYQRSLSRKRNRKGHLVEVVEIPNKIQPSSKSKVLNGDLWLPPTSAGPGLTRPS